MRGMDIIKLEDKYQMTSRADYAECISEIIPAKTLRALQAPTLETLAVIAYRQPVTKSEIDKIRGVDSKYALTKLLEKELIYEAGKIDELPNKPMSYKTTDLFLKTFGLEKISDLPDLDSFAENILERAEEDAEYDIID
jgi:segregation and condensation protein B